MVLLIQLTVMLKHTHLYYKGELIVKLILSTTFRGYEVFGNSRRI